MAIDWAAGGYGVLSWHARRVDPATWAEGAPLDGVRSLSVDGSDEEDAPLLESAEVTLDAPVGSEPFAGWLRLSATCEQAGQAERVDLFTGWFEKSSGDVERGADSRSLAGRSPLWPCSRNYVWDTYGTYAPAGCDGAEAAYLMLSGTTPAPVVVEGGFTIDDHVVFEESASNLEAAWLILRAGGYSIRLGGDGTITIGPRPTEPALSLDAALASLLVPSVSVDDDRGEIPNRYVAVDGTEVAVATNDDPASPVSTVARGWVHSVRDTSPVRVNGETLAAYAARRLEEESTVHERRTYSREWWPGVRVGSVVRGSLASVDLEGDMHVARQRFDCEHGILVEEEAQREVMLWRRS